MILRILRVLNRVYPFLVFFGYMVAFVIAFVCMFSFPLGALVLVIGSVLSLALVVFVGEVMRGIEGVLARRSLRKNRCPACRMGPVQDNAPGYRCLGCGIRFEPSGAQTIGTDEELAEVKQLVAAD